MITPPTPSYFVVRVEGEAAESVTAVLSEGAIADVLGITLISTDFQSDIQASISMDATISSIRTQLLDPTISEDVVYNPLYIPSTVEQIEDMLDMDDDDLKAEHVRFVGMDGDPFAIKQVMLTSEQRGDVLLGTLACKQFELPAFNEVVKSHRKILLN